MSPLYSLFQFYHCHHQPNTSIKSCNQRMYFTVCLAMPLNDYIRKEAAIRTLQICSFLSLLSCLTSFQKSFPSAMEQKQGIEETHYNFFKFKCNSKKWKKGREHAYLCNNSIKFFFSISKLQTSSTPN